MRNKMTKTQKKLAEQILKGLERQPFANFYAEDGEFDEYIQNRIYEPEKREQRKKEILERITELFDLK